MPPAITQERAGHPESFRTVGTDKAFRNDRSDRAKTRTLGCVSRFCIITVYARQYYGGIRISLEVAR